METQSHNTLPESIWLQVGVKQNHRRVLSEDWHDLTYFFFKNLFCYYDYKEQHWKQES